MLAADEQMSPPTQVNETRFYAVIVTTIVLLAVATAAVILYANHPRLRVRLELDGTMEAASSRPRITLRFARPVAPESVESRLDLTPDVPFALDWREREVQLVLEEPLQPSTTYTLTLAAGVTDPNGQILSGEAKWKFTTRPLRLVFLGIPVEENAGPTLQMADLDGNVRQLSAPGQYVQDFGVSPNGSQVVYGVNEGPNTVNFWLVRPGVRGWDRLTNEQGVVYSAPRWSPAGDLFAHEERRVISIAGEFRLSNPKIALMRPDGSPAGIVYGQGGDEVGHSPLWSPDGTRLAFFDSATESIAIFNFTDNLRRFPGSSGSVGSWSPDGRSLVTTAIQPDGQGVRQLLTVLDLDLGTEHFIEEPTGHMVDPAWSPDGAWIAYAYQPPLGLARGSEIVLVSPDDGERVVVVSRADMTLSNPVWSPAGDWLAFSQFSLTDPDARPEVWIVRPDGSDLRLVAEDAYLPQWLP